MLVGSTVHPSLNCVLPVNFEPIERGDGDKKNDCEHTAGKRFLDSFRSAHLQLPTIFLGDGLYSDGPFIKKLNEKRMRYVLVAREKDHKSLNEYFCAGEGEDVEDFTEVREKNLRYRFMNKAPLNDSHPDLLVNVVYFEELDTKPNKMTKWMWVTDLDVTKENIREITRGTRTR